MRNWTRRGEKEGRDALLLVAWGSGVGSSGLDVALLEGS